VRPRGRRAARAIAPILILGGVLGAAVAPARAQTAPAPSVEDLARLSQNPLSGLRSLEVSPQINVDTPDGHVQSTLSLEATWPFALDEHWLLVSYSTLSAVWQDGTTQRNPSLAGLGPTVIDLLVTPSESGSLIWGAGPVVQLPTTTNDALGSDRFALGPALVLAVQPGPVTAGVLVQNLWSFDGDGADAIDVFSAQYFLSYNLPRGWFLQSNATITADWKAPAGDRFTVPLGAGFGKVFQLGRLSLSASAQALWNAATPPGVGRWAATAQLSLLLP